MILSGKLRKGRRLFREKIPRDFNVSETISARAFSGLKKDGVVIIEGSLGSFVATF
jgi:DNA-binding GntR family transcriptional regulator